MAEEAQHRHHAVDGVEQRRRRGDVSCGKGLAQRQEVAEQLDQRAGVARDVPAVGQDLPLQLVRQFARGAADVLGLVGQAQRGVAQCDQHLQPWHAVADVDHGVAQIADLARQAAQVTPIELAVGVAEHQRRLRQQRDHAARQHVGSPLQRPLARLVRHPVVDQRARIGAGQRGIGGAQMTQPAEAEQRDFPVFRGRIEVEDRAAVAGDDLAGEHEAPGIDLGGAGGVRRTQIVRGDGEAVGASGPQPRQRDRAAAGAGHHVPRKAAHDQRRDSSALSDRHAVPWEGGGPAIRI